MFKKIKFFVFALFFGVNLHAISEGVEYNVLENPIPNSNNTLTEIWSYQCSHCYLHYTYDTLDYIKDKIKDLNINLMMVKSWGQFGKEMANLLAYAEYEDSKNKLNPSDKNSKYDEITKLYFIDLFKNNQKWNNDPKEFYKLGLNSLDISLKKLEKFISSPEGEYLLKSTDVADEIANLVGTPAFVVNGKYVINLAHVKTSDDLVEIISELLKLK